MHVGYLAALVGIFQSVILTLLRLDVKFAYEARRLERTRQKKKIFNGFVPLFSQQIEPLAS